VKIGQACAQAADCGNSYECIGAPGWCTAECTSDTTCGESPTGYPNRCVENAASRHICFPGCSSDADCSSYPGTTCDGGSCGKIQPAQ
jgi:hypothetical protein